MADEDCQAALRHKRDWLRDAKAQTTEERRCFFLSMYVDEIVEQAYRHGARAAQHHCARIADSYTDGIASEASASVAHGIAAAIRSLAAPCLCCDAVYSRTGIFPDDSREGPKDDELATR